MSEKQKQNGMMIKRREWNIVIMQLLFLKDSLR